MVEAELRAKLAAAIEVSREIEDEATEWVQQWIDGQYRAPVAVGRLAESVAEFAAWGGLRGNASPDSAARLAFEAATFDYYAATVLELFADDSGLEQFLRAGDSTEIDPVAEDAVETLARARQQLAIGPGLAWESVAVAREARGLARWKDPRGTGGDPMLAA